MTPEDLVRRRVAGHAFADPAWTTPVDVVVAFGPMQAQDHHASTWAVGARTIGGTCAIVERAISDGALLRTHALRNTIHLVAPGDVRWILALTSQRMLARAATRYAELGLDGKTFIKAETIMARALAARHLDRKELGAALEKGGVSVAGQRFVHLVHHAELVELVISGERRGRQNTFALFDERVPAQKARAKDVALADLARRFFARRSPATLADFTWWSGLVAGEARDAVAAIEGELERDGAHFFVERAEVVHEGVQLLPAFDEYTVAYKTRDEVVAPGANLSGFALLSPTVVVRGRVAGTWRRTVVRDRVTIDAVGKIDRDELAVAADRYAAFLGHCTVAEARITARAKRARS